MQECFTCCIVYNEINNGCVILFSLQYCLINCFKLLVLFVLIYQSKQPSGSICTLGFRSFPHHSDPVFTSYFVPKQESLYNSNFTIIFVIFVIISFIMIMSLLLFFVCSDQKAMQFHAPILNYDKLVIYLVYRDSGIGLLQSILLVNKHKIYSKFFSDIKSIFIMFVAGSHPCYFSLTHHPISKLSYAQFYEAVCG